MIIYAEVRFHRPKDEQYWGLTLKITAPNWQSGLYQVEAFKAGLSFSKKMSMDLMELGQTTSGKAFDITAPELIWNELNTFVRR